MRKFITFTLGLLLITFSSCDSSNKTDSTNTSREETQLGRELTQSEENNMKRRKQRRENSQKSMNSEENNLLSPYRYIISSDDYTVFSNLLQNSSLSKHVHNSGVTIFAPNNSAFDSIPEFKSLLNDDNEKHLDNFISNHIVDQTLDYKTFISEPNSWTMNSGESYVFDKRDGLKFNSAELSAEHADTDNGTVIGMNEVIYFPALR